MSYVIVQPQNLPSAGFGNKADFAIPACNITEWVVKDLDFSNSHIPALPLVPAFTNKPGWLQGMEEQPEQEKTMSYITMKEMLEAGLHFGHQTHRWNPKMKPYIFGARNNIYIINLDKTLPLFNKAYKYVTDTVAKGGSILFVATKRQAQEIIRDEAERCGMFYVNHRWLGGMLTNYQTIKQSIERLKKLQSMKEDGTINYYKKKEIMQMEKELEKLERNLGGIKDMRGLPSVIFVIDPKRENIAVEEANRLGIPVVSMADTNCDPEGINYIIPGNDDSIKSIKLIAGKIADAVMAGAQVRTESAQAEADKEGADEATTKAAEASTVEKE